MNLPHPHQLLRGHASSSPALPTASASSTDGVDTNVDTTTRSVARSTSRHVREAAAAAAAASASASYHHGLPRRRYFIPDAHGNIRDDSPILSLNPSVEAVFDAHRRAFLRELQHEHQRVEDAQDDAGLKISLPIPVAALQADKGKHHSNDRQKDEGEDEDEDEAESKETEEVTEAILESCAGECQHSSHQRAATAQEEDNVRLRTQAEELQKDCNLITSIVRQCPGCMYKLKQSSKRRMI